MTARPIWPRVAEEALWDLVAERTASGADRAAVDRRLWERFGDRRAILYTDLTGFSRRVAAFGITHFLAVIYEQMRLFVPVVERHGGTLVKVEADSLLLTFATPAEALACAREMRAATWVHNGERAPEDQVLLCSGIGFGKVLRVGDVEVYGAEVNAASKLGEDTAKTDEILVTHAVREALDHLPGLTFVPLDVTVAGSERNYRVETGERRPPAA